MSNPALAAPTITAATSDGRLRTAAGVAYFALAAQFMVAIMAGASMVPGYDVQAGAISDLGVLPATALLFNASLVATGLLNIVGAVLLNLAERRSVLLALSLAAGAGAIGAGVFPLDTGDLHGIFALLAFLFFNLQIVPAAIRLTGPIRVVGLGLAAIGLAYVVVMIIGDGGNPAVFGAIGHGGAERMIAYPPMLWLMAYGGYLMATGRNETN
jgi:hypothetical membrane protein